MEVEKLVVTTIPSLYVRYLHSHNALGLFIVFTSVAVLICFMVFVFHEVGFAFRVLCFLSCFRGCFELIMSFLN